MNIFTFKLLTRKTKLFSYRLHVFCSRIHDLCATNVVSNIHDNRTVTQNISKCLIPLLIFTVFDLWVINRGQR